jgi:hypothetical protein
MRMQLLLRFFIGGAAVTIFAALGDILLSKSFAGLFGAAPSIASATLVLTALDKGAAYAAIEGRSMILGAAAFAVYAWTASCLMLKCKLPAMAVTTVGIGIWVLVAFGGLMFLLRDTAP